MCAEADRARGPTKYMNFVLVDLRRRAESIWKVSSVCPVQVDYVWENELSQNATEPRMGDGKKKYL